MKTLFLDPVLWDLVLDSGGNIAVAAEPYALAQDAASAIRTFLGECYYNTDLGVPYFASILGAFPVPISLIKSQMVDAALTVPGVTAAQVFLTSIKDRELTGQVQVTNVAGAVFAATF